MHVCIGLAQKRILRQLKLLNLRSPQSWGSCFLVPQLITDPSTFIGVCGSEQRHLSRPSESEIRSDNARRAQCGFHDGYVVTPHLCPMTLAGHSASTSPWHFFRTGLANWRRDPPPTLGKMSQLNQKLIDLNAGPYRARSYDCAAASQRDRLNINSKDFGANTLISLNAVSCSLSLGW
jgi:hypothetical protein